MSGSEVLIAQLVVRVNRITVGSLLTSESENRSFENVDDELLVSTTLAVGRDDVAVDT